VHLRIQIMEPSEPAHLEGVVVHGGESVFWHDVVEAQDAGVGGGEFGGGEFKGEQGLGEDLFAGKAAEDLEEEADLDGAGGGGRICNSRSV
jgi:hypothetical protein